MNIHVFVVDATTFKLHLEYMFAGTGAKDKMSTFLYDNDCDCHYSTERNLVSMIADISRIRIGDKIIFYLQATTTNQGMFFGVFKAVSKGFFDENDQNNYLKNELGKGLSFRINISADCVYPLGITEHELLDDLNGKEAPYELCWSMIYRKLKGNRGCTMITQYEYEDLVAKLKEKNNEQILYNDYYSFDLNESSIVPIEEKRLYTGRRNDLNIKPRLLYKAHRNNAFETHLQALVMQNFDRDILKNKLLILGNDIVWIGNEVFCGFGMQRIDIMIIEENETEIHIKIVEIKDEEPINDILEVQLPWYLKWVSQYIIPNLQKKGKMIVLHPCIIARRTENDNVLDEIRNKEWNIINMQNVNITSTEYIGFDILEADISFEKIIY